ncbi:MAG: DinB family protein [Parafilimonas sp.]
MENEILNKLKIITGELVGRLSSFSPEQFNKVPFEGSWTAGQLAEHVTRSINGMGEALNMPGKIADRKPDEKVNDFKTMFLNFDTKMKSPPFILPAQDVYAKDLMIDKFKNAGKQFVETGSNVNLSELLNLPPIGELTKLELLHFVLYHTQRHVHQLKNIEQKVLSK